MIQISRFPKTANAENAGKINGVAIFRDDKGKEIKRSTCFYIESTDLMLLSKGSRFGNVKDKAHTAMSYTCESEDFDKKGLSKEEIEKKEIEANFRTVKRFLSDYFGINYDEANNAFIKDGRIMTINGKKMNYKDVILSMPRAEKPVVATQFSLNPYGSKDTPCKRGDVQYFINPSTCAFSDKEEEGYVPYYCTQVLFLSHEDAVAHSWREPSMTERWNNRNEEGLYLPAVEEEPNAAMNAAYSF